MPRDDAVLGTVISQALRHRPGDVALADGDRTVTYHELDALSARAGMQFVADRPGPERLRVGLQAGNSIEYVVAYLALVRSDCVPFLIDRSSRPEETDALARECGLDLLVHEAGAAAPPGAAPERTLSPGLAVSTLPTGRGSDRPALAPGTQVCRFTSGSTGRPHCIEFSGRAVHAAAVNWADGTGLGSQDRTLCFAALSNGLAFNTSLLSTFLVGAQLHLATGLPTAARTIAQLHASAATRLVGFPALYESLVRRGRPETFPALQMAISSAAPLTADTISQFTGLTGVTVRNYYGVAEAGPLTFARDPGADPGLGQPLPGVSVRAGTRDAPAAIEVRSESMGTGYLNTPGLLQSRTSPQGYYRTGDLGYLIDGSLVLTGRTSQVINVGGRKVDALEVGEVLQRADGVQDVVVLEVMDQHGSPALGAVLAGVPAPDPAATRRFAGQHLAPHKVPSLIRTVTEIPRGSTGKPGLTALRRLFE